MRTFATDHPKWRDRVEVGYVGRAVLQTFAAEATGTIAVISPGEPLHITEPRLGWVLNWYGVCADGEVLHGPPPLELGPALSATDYRRLWPSCSRSGRTRSAPLPGSGTSRPPRATPS